MMIWCMFRIWYLYMYGDHAWCKCQVCVGYDIGISIATRVGYAYLGSGAGSVAIGVV